jgi:predicted RNA-binding Zn-ribbon protein involved in translation (DUF1610 family)
MFIKKHYCPLCSNKLSTIKVSKIVDKESDEVREFLGDPFDYKPNWNDIKLIWHNYYCAHCDIEITYKDMRKYECGGKEKVRSEKQRTMESILYIIMSIAFLLIVTTWGDGKTIRYRSSSAGLIYIYIRKHNCPECGHVLTVKYTSKIVNSESPEAKYYSFIALDGTRLRGDVDFREPYLQCQSCGYSISIKDMKIYEKQNSRK